MRWILFLAMEVGGVILMVYGFKIVNLFGHQQWAERRFGPGGTYLMWRMAAIILILGGIAMLRYGGDLGL
jgi:hypothetical protein